MSCTTYASCKLSDVTNIATNSLLYMYLASIEPDCTPVLIGSISLGLIQLIVIGLEVATNVDLLSENRWPLYLPLLQFAFVSLLMQYILGKVSNIAAASQLVGQLDDNNLLPAQASILATILAPLLLLVSAAN